MSSVTALWLTPVKGTRVRAVETIELTEEHGARGNRSFYLIDERGDMVNGKRLGALQTVVSEYDAAAGELALSFPDGARVAAPVRYGETIPTRFFSRPREAQELAGPWSEALSAHAGQPLRIVADGTAVDRGRRASVSLISRASLERLAEVGEIDSVDARRFRMLIEVDGVPAHEEDRWVGRRIRVGPALLLVRGNVGRCMVTARNPESGEVDLKTLHFLAEYRQDEETSEELAFGVYGEVLTGGTVRLGDPVEPAG